MRVEFRSFLVVLLVASMSSCFAQETTTVLSSVYPDCCTTCNKESTACHRTNETYPGCVCVDLPPPSTPLPAANLTTALPVEQASIREVTLRPDQCVDERNQQRTLKTQYSSLMERRNKLMTEVSELNGTLFVERDQRRGQLDELNTYIQNLTGMVESVHRKIYSLMNETYRALKSQSENNEMLQSEAGMLQTKLEAMDDMQYKKVESLQQNYNKVTEGLGKKGKLNLLLKKAETEVSEKEERNLETAKEMGAAGLAALDSAVKEMKIQSNTAKPQT